MSGQEIKQSVEEIVALALSGKGAEVWVTYYHKDVQKIDLDGINLKGKEKVIEANHAMLGGITSVRQYAHGGTVVKGNRSFIVWDVDCDIKDQGALKVKEVCVQDWEDGKIIRERFFA